VTVFQNHLLRDKKVGPILETVRSCKHGLYIWYAQKFFPPLCLLSNPVSPRSVQLGDLHLPDPPAFGDLVSPHLRPLLLGTHGAPYLLGPFPLQRPAPPSLPGTTSAAALDNMAAALVLRAAAACKFEQKMILTLSSISKYHVHKYRLNVFVLHIVDMRQHK
jgi:hypothetical protein